MRTLVGFLLSSVLLFTLWSCRVTIPQTAEDVNGFDDILAFLAETTETAVEGITIHAYGSLDEEPLVLHDEQIAATIKLFEDANCTLTPYVEEEHKVYYGSSHEMQFHLEEDAVVTLKWHDVDLYISREELNAEGKWTYSLYDIVSDDPHFLENFTSYVDSLWYEAYAIPEGESRTISDLLGAEIGDAHEIVLYGDFDGDSDTEIRLYVWTDQHPELLTALTTLTVRQNTGEAEADRDTYGQIHVGFHLGEKDYRFSKDHLTKNYTMIGDSIGLCPSGIVGYQIVEDEPGTFATWLKTWMEENKDTDGVKIVRWGKKK